jgi:hypothetical protein
MRLCLADSMIAQYRGTIPKRVKNCKEIDNLTTFLWEYVVNILMAKKWTGIEHQKKKTQPTSEKGTPYATPTQNSTEISIQAYIAIHSGLNNTIALYTRLNQDFIGSQTSNVTPHIRTLLYTH